jgi:hypothetical protein
MRLERLKSRLKSGIRFYNSGHFGSILGQKTGEFEGVSGDFHYFKLHFLSSEVHIFILYQILQFPRADNPQGED